MRILHVVPSYLPATRYGGPIHSVHGLCRALAKAGHQISVFTTNVDGAGNSDVPLGQSVELDGVNVWYFPSKKLRRLYWAPKLKQALREQIGRFDIVHLHSVFLWPTWAAARAARKAGVPYLIAPRGMLVKDLVKRKSRWLKTAWIRLIERRNLEYAAGIHVTAPIEQMEIEKFGFALPPCHFVPNGIDAPELQDLAEADFIGPNVPYVLFLSRINWKKGLDRLVKAWKKVPDMLLVIAGNDEEGYQEKIEAMALAEVVKARILFLGPISGAGKWSLFKNAKLFVLPSYSENFGNVVLEAMAMGCPVVVTPEVGAASIVEQAGCGIVVDGAPEILGHEISQLLMDDEGLRLMGAKGREAALSSFRWSTLASGMEKVYKSILVNIADEQK